MGMMKCQIWNLQVEVLESILGSVSWEFALDCKCLSKVSVLLWWWYGSVTSCILNPWVVDVRILEQLTWETACTAATLLTEELWSVPPHNLVVRCRRRRPSGTRTERSTAWRRTASSSCTREDLFAAGKRSAACGGKCLSEVVFTPSAGPALPSGRERWLVSTLCFKSTSFHPFF